MNPTAVWTDLESKIISNSDQSVGNFPACSFKLRRWEFKKENKKIKKKENTPSTKKKKKEYKISTKKKKQDLNQERKKENKISTKKKSKFKDLLSFF